MKLLRSEEGNALVEVAFALPVLAMLLGGTIDYAMYAERKIQVTEAANAGAGYGAIAGNQKNSTGMQNAAKAASPALSGMTATGSYYYACTPTGAAVSSTTSCTGGTPIQYVKVQTSATITPPLGVAGLPGNITVTGQAIYRVAWTQ